MTAPLSPLLPAPGVLDRNFAVDSIILVGWVLNNRVDPTKVQRAWLKLQEYWPVLGARLRKDTKTSKWEYLPPSLLSTSTTFNSLHIPAPIRSIYSFSSPASASSSPSGSPRITVTPKPSPLDILLPAGPRSMSDLINKERSLTHCNVTNFIDGSVVVLAIPHMCCDAGGVAGVARGLERVLSGGIPERCPLREGDPFEKYVVRDIDTSAEELEPPPNWKLPSYVETGVLILRHLYTTYFGEKMENRDIYFPFEEVCRIKNDAMRDIEREFGKESGLWVSSSDAIAAFCLKCAHAPSPSDSTTPVNVFYTLNVRSLLGLPKAYLHNAVSFIVTNPLTPIQITQMSLGSLALHIRKTVQEQGTKEAVEGWMRWRLTNEGKIQVCFDPFYGHWHIFTNWREMGLMGVDFSPAMYDGDLEKGKGKVKCEYLWVDGLGPVLRDWIGMLADDPVTKGMWVAGTFSKKIWEDKRGFGKFIT